MSKARRVKWVATLVGLGGAGALLVSHLRTTSFGEANTWQRQVIPGALSTAHAFLEKNCATCHTPVIGVEAQSCVQCHAADERLLKRQPTAFHAQVRSCTGCHREHQGRTERMTRMDHAELARIGLGRFQTSANTYSGSGDRNLLASIRGLKVEGRLDCAACHSNQDHHFKLFGSDCAECHETESWKITGFRHPGAASRDCSQCHQAPPSHYMEHFAMVSMKVARVEHASVTQCYLCHQTTAWNDIKDVGWYKHH